MQHFPPHNKLLAHCVSAVNITLISILLIVSSGCNLPGSTSTVRPLIPTHAPTATQPQPASIPSQTPIPQVIEGTVTIWHSWSESEMPALVQIIAAFNVIYPDVYFDVLFIPQDELRGYYESETREGRGPTLLLGIPEWGPLLSAQGLISNLDGKIDPALLPQINPAGLDQGIYKGKRIGLPYSLKGVVLYRNKDIITLSAQTFDELIMLAQSSTQGETIGASLERSYMYSGAHLLGLGGRLMDENGMPVFNDEKGLAWLNCLDAFEQTGSTSFLNNQDLSAFQEGRVGWIIDGTWNMTDIAESIGVERLAIDPWPRYQDGKLAGFVLSDMLFLSVNARDQRELVTLKFSEYLLSVSAQTFLASINRIPANLTVNIGETLTQTLISQASVALSGGFAYPVTPEAEIYRDNIDAGLRSFFDGNQPADSVLRNMLDAIQLAIQDRRAQTPSP